MIEVEETPATDHAEEDPPFALPESSSSPHGPQHLLEASTTTRIKKVGFPEHLSDLSTIFKVAKTEQSNDAALSSSMNNPPGLTESVFSETSFSSSPSAASDSPSPSKTSSLVQSTTASAYLDSSSQFMLSSIRTVASTATVGGGSISASQLPYYSIDLSKTDATIPSPQQQQEVSRGAVGADSVGFSQLMDAANDSKVLLHQSTAASRMPVVPEHRELEREEGQHDISSDAASAFSLGTLISASPFQQEDPVVSKQEPATDGGGGWFPNLFARNAQNTTIENDLHSPLLESTTSVGSLLSYEPSPMSIAQAREGIQSSVCNGNSFEVSMRIENRCSVEEMMNILASPSLLKLWCAPIHALVVTQSSEGAAANSVHSEQGREYEGEWVEATTASLESPPSNISYFERASQAVLDTLGFCSYGSVRMFIERRRGQVGLTVGPFSGGIHAAHKFSVEQGSDGYLRVVDRVCLTKEEEDLGSISNMFLCGMMDSLNRCLLPSVSAYMEQTIQSLAQLRVLSQNERFRGSGN